VPPSYQGLYDFGICVLALSPDFTTAGSIPRSSACHHQRMLISRLVSGANVGRGDQASLISLAQRPVDDQFFAGAFGPSLAAIMTRSASESAFILRMT
jgi:hypothetical protein